MASKQTKKRFRNFMYEQQLSYLPNNMTVDEMYTHIEQTLMPKRMACIIHDKDIKKDNKTPVEPHVHIMMQFENARSVNQVAKDIGDNNQQVQIWDDRAENGFAYLIHATDNSRHRHQYDCSEVRANFDFDALIIKTALKVRKLSESSNANRINGLLDLVALGKITIAEARNQMTGSDYAKSSDKLKKAHELYLERSSEELHAQMVENNEMVDVHWFYGESETGKTFLAENLANDIGMPYYKTFTTTDPFQFYQGEETIILDELRPEVIPYSELLAILDPFSRGRIAVSSRYYNKALSCRTIFITSPYDPMTFYYGYKLLHIDKGEQLFRRLSSVIKFDMNWIYKMEYQANYRRYMVVDKKPNRYSKKNQSPYTLHNVFDSIK